MRDPAEAPEIGRQFGRLLRRADFLRVGKGKRWHAKAMTLQAAPTSKPGAAVRVGFTLTRKVGNAVVRNRARRRLKEALRRADGLSVEPGHDYVIVGRIDAVYLPFDRLQSELFDAFKALRGRSSTRKPDGKRKPDRAGTSPESTETR